MAHTGLTLGLDVNWKSIGASLDLFRNPEAIDMLFDGQMLSVDVMVNDELTRFKSTRVSVYSTTRQLLLLQLVHYAYIFDQTRGLTGCT